MGPGRTAIRIIYTLALIITLWAPPSHADELQDRIVAAIQAYADLTPNHPDIAIGWAQMYVDAAVELSNPSEVIKTTAIGDWIAGNQPDDTDPALRAQRVEWLANAFKHVMKVNAKFDTAFPSQPISVSELQLRVTTAVDDVLPGPSRAEIAAQEAEAIQRSRESAEAIRQRRFPQ